MEKYEIIKHIENFDKRIKDINDVLNIDNLNQEIKQNEQLMLNDEF